MRVRANGLVRTGDAVDLRRLDVTADAVVAAVRDGAPDRVAVDCPEPTAVHEYVGHIHEGMGLPIRAALAMVARRRGARAPQDEAIRQVEAELDALDPPPVDLAEPRERLATADQADIERLRERVAACRGAKVAREDLGADPESAAERLTETAGRLADAETELVAAEQALERARERAREARDVRERRLRLQDRRDNLRRAARRHLATRLRDPFAAAVEAVPGDGEVPARPADFDGDPVTAALAVARLADYRAPVVLSAGRFETAAAAATVLDGPVVLA